MYGPLDSEGIETRHDWYKRIANDFGWSVVEWKYYNRTTATIPAAKGMYELNEIQKLIEIISLDQGANSLIIDLSSYKYCRHADWDRLEKGWQCIDRFEQVVIIFNEKASVTNSKSLKKMYLSKNEQSETLFIIDSKGKMYTWDNVGKSEHLKKPTLKQHIENIDRNKFRKLVLTKSKRYFGHFVNPSGAHIRTHYDVSSLIKYKGRVYDYILANVREIQMKANFDLIIGFGLESSGIVPLCHNLSQDLEVTHFYYTGIVNGQLMEAIQQDKQKVLLLTDVLLTGRTADQLIIEIEKGNGEVVHVISIVGLSNSKEKLKGRIPVTFCAKLNRPFYDTSIAEPCPLCMWTEIEPCEVHDEHSFHDSAKRDISDYDFWELVVESKALIKGHQTSDNNKNHYLVKLKTEKILSVYGNFVAAVLAERLKKAIGENLIHIIVCPKEEGAGHLAYHIAEKLTVSPANVVYIDRRDLEKCSPAKVNVEVAHKYEEKLSECGIEWPCVLVVDDGINSLHTLQHMASLLGDTRANVKGYAVFLDATNDTIRNNIKRILAAPLVSFYRWTLGPFPESECPHCWPLR